MQVISQNILGVSSLFFWIHEANVVNKHQTSVYTNALFSNCIKRRICMLRLSIIG